MSLRVFVVIPRGRVAFCLAKVVFPQVGAALGCGRSRLCASAVNRSPLRRQAAARQIFARVIGRYRDVDRSPAPDARHHAPPGGMRMLISAFMASGM